MTMALRVQYGLTMPDPSSHYYHVDIQFSGGLPETFEVRMPVWTPGSYLVREYARHVTGLRAESANGPEPVVRLDKAAWQVILPPGTGRLTLSYDVYAYDLTVRTSYLDHTYGLVSPTSVFMYPSHPVDGPLELQITPPEGWDIATGLDPAGSTPGLYVAPDYDTLADAPIQLGPLTRHTFHVQGVPHTVVVGGKGRESLPSPQFLEHLAAIVNRAATVFGGLPYRHYTFMVTLAQQGGGGLEHLNSANIIVSRDTWIRPKHYPDLLSLFAHEFFHLWNVKRLRPSQLGPFDYQNEVYTTLLWALEGLTDYFAQWLLAQSGVVPADEVLKTWANHLAALEMMPGRHVTALDESSLLAWIRQYRPDSNTPNLTVSYYLKGSLAGIFLDLELRRATGGQKSLPTVFRGLWDQYGDHGYPERAFEDALIKAGGEHMRQTLNRYVHGMDDFDDRVFASVGLTLERTVDPAEDVRVWLGLDVVERQGRLHARFVAHRSPAEIAGIAPDDELIAIDSERVTSVEQLRSKLSRHQPGDAVRIDLFHDGILESAIVSAQSPRPSRYRLLPRPDATEHERQAFQEWLGAPLPEAPQ